MHALPPYAVIPAEFRFRALATLAGKLPLGGPREFALATFMGARLVSDAVGADALPVEVRRTRAAAARQWCTALALPTALRQPAVRLIDASGGDNLAVLAAALEEVVSLAGPSLDAASRTELRRLASLLPAAVA